MLVIGVHGKRELIVMIGLHDVGRFNVNDRGAWYWES